MATWHWCCCPKSTPPVYYSSDDETTVPCTDCGIDQADAAVSTTATGGWPCEADGVYAFDSFQDNLNGGADGYFCSWRWELDNGGVDNWNLVVMYFKSLDEWRVSLYDLVIFEEVYHAENVTEISCGADGILIGTINITSDSATCAGEEAVITLG